LSFVSPGCERALRQSKTGLGVAKIRIHPEYLLIKLDRGIETVVPMLKHRKIE
jgi:hypothetical protein